MVKITIDSLRKEYDTPEGRINAVDGIDLQVDDGEFVTLLGPSGCGKTTTLRCIAGLESPTSGTIRFGGDDMTDVPGNKRNLAMMFQNIALYPHMKVIENIAYPLKVRHIPKDERHERAKKGAESMEISDLLDKYPNELSGGQRQRAALARTIVQDPVAFLMDEPLSDLDAKLKATIQSEIQQVHKQLGKPTIYVTHDQAEAQRMSDRIAVMRDGKIVQIGSPRDIYHEPVNRFIGEFIGSPSMNFIEGTLDAIDEGAATLRISNKEYQLENIVVEKQPNGNEVEIGFRPQSASFSNSSADSDFSGQITLLEPLDEQTLATVDLPEGSIKAIVDGGESLSEGSTVGVEIDRSSIFVFDSKSGELIARHV